MTTTPDSVTANYLKGLLGKPALTTLGLVAATVFGVAAVMSLLIITALMAPQSGDFLSAGLGTVLSLFACVIAGVLGSGWAGNGSVNAYVFSADGTISLTIFSLTTLLAIVVGTTMVAKRRLTHDVLAPTVALAALRAGLEGLAIGLAFMAVFGFVKLQAPNISGVDGQLHGKPFAIVVTLTLIIAVTLFVTREGAREQSPVSAFLSRPFVAETRAFFTATFAVFTPLLLALLVFVALQQSFTTALALIPFLGNALLGLIAMGYLGGATAEIPMAPTDLLMAWNVSPWFALCVFIFAALSIAAAAIAVGLHRQRTDHFRAGALWRLPVGAAVTWFVIVLVILPIRMTAGMGSFGAMKMIMTVSWWVPFSAAAVAFIVSAFAEFAPRWMYLTSPKALHFFASQKTVNQWLSGVANVTAPTIPAPMPAPAADTLVEPAEHPLAQTAPEPEVCVEPQPPLEATEPGETSVLADATSQEETAVLAQATPLEETIVLDQTAQLSGEIQPADTGTGESQPGGAQPALGASAPLALPERAPLTPEKKRRVIAVIVTVLAVIVALVAGLITVKVLNGSRGPETAVEQYLSLIAKGKLEAATDTVDPGVRNTERALLTSDVFNAADHRVEVVNVRASEASLSGDAQHATVEAELSIDGARQTVHFEAQRGANSFGILHNWNVTTPLVQKVRFEAPFEFDTIEIGDTAVEVGPSEMADEWSDQHITEAYLYPGEYTFSIPNSEYTEFETVTATVMPQETLLADPRSNEPVSVEFEANASESLQKAVLKLVNEEFTKCVTIPTNMQDFCPYVVQNDQLAVLELGTLPDDFEEFDFSSFMTKPGSVKTQRNSTEWSDYDLEETKVAMSGQYSIVDGKVVIENVSSTTSFWGW